MPVFLSPAIRGDGEGVAPGLRQVFIGEPFGEEFPVADDVEFEFLFASAIEGFGISVAGADGTRAFAQHDPVETNGGGGYWLGFDGEGHESVGL